MFEKHPHFVIFPGDAIEVMPVLPILAVSATRSIAPSEAGSWGTLKNEGAAIMRFMVL
jgi:hypothetical protein